MTNTKEKRKVPMIVQGRSFNGKNKVETILLYILELCFNFKT